VGACLRTPPHNLVLSEVDDSGAIEAIAADAHELYDSLPGAVGPAAVVKQFVRAWQTLTGVPARVSRAERIYAARFVTLSRGVPGGKRPAEAIDRQLLVEWVEAFISEALAGPVAEDPARMVDRRLGNPDGGFMTRSSCRPRSCSSEGWELKSGRATPPRPARFSRS
jgi:uncharacterized protein